MRLLTPMTRLYQFKSARLEVDDAARFARTVFADGTEVPAVPHATEEYEARALDLGYPDAWQMCWQHEALHHVYADMMGQPHSVALWSVAHRLPPGPADYDEEAAVLALQRFLNGGPDDRHVRRLANRLKLRTVAVLRHEVTAYLKACRRRA